MLFAQFVFFLFFVCYESAVRHAVTILEID